MSGITFQVIKGEGIRRNRETGVEIVTLTFNGKATGDYEVRRPTREGYEAVGTTTNAAEARALAEVQVKALRLVIARAVEAAKAEDEEHILDCEFCGSRNGTSYHWNSPSGATGVAFTCDDCVPLVDELRDDKQQVTRRRVHEARAAYSAERRAARATQPTKVTEAVAPVFTGEQAAPELECDVCGHNPNAITIHWTKSADGRSDIYLGRTCVPHEHVIRDTRDPQTGRTTPEAVHAAVEAAQAILLAGEPEPQPEPAPVPWEHGLQVVFAADATVPAPKGHEGQVFETDYRAEPTEGPGGRWMVQVFRSYTDPAKGSALIAPMVWLDELRTTDGARITC